MRRLQCSAARQRDVLNDVHKAIEYYYQWLREGVHFLSVNAENILSEIRRVETNATLRMALVKGARAFQRQHLSQNAIVARWWSILEPLHARQTSSPPDIPVGACTCDDGLVAKIQQRSPEVRNIKECKKCEIVRMKDSRLAKFIGVVPKTPTPV